MTPAGQRWTKRKPTEPGWYWHRNTMLPSVDPSPVQIVRLIDGELAACWNISTVRLEKVSTESEWQGPLTPNEATE